MKKKNILLISLILLIILSVSVNAFSIKDIINKIMGLPYSNPEIVNAELYPQKIMNSEVMLITVAVKDNYGIQSAKAIIPHEFGSDEADMVIIAGTDKKGTYEARWIAHDLEMKWYNATVIVINNKNKISTQKIPFYDPSQNHPASEVTAGTFGSGNYTFDGSNYDLFIDDTNGRVGIGTTSPSVELEVDGNVSVSGNISATGQIHSLVPAARVYHDADITISTVVWTSLNFSKERFDTDNIFNTAVNNNSLTVRTPGLYQITGHARFQLHATGYRGLRIRLNKVTDIGTMFQLTVGDGASTQITVTTLYELEVGDAVEIEAYQASGGNLDIEARGNYSPEFMMVRVG